jgi:hypothetical protein
MSSTTWEIIISCGAILTGVLYIVFSFTVICMQLRNELTDEEGHSEEKAPEKSPSDSEKPANVV